MEGAGKDGEASGSLTSPSVGGMRGARMRGHSCASWSFCARAVRRSKRQAESADPASCASRGPPHKGGENLKTLRAPGSVASARLDPALKDQACGARDGQSRRTASVVGNPKYPMEGTGFPLLSRRVDPPARSVPEWVRQNDPSVRLNCWPRIPSKRVVRVPTEGMTRFERERQAHPTQRRTR